jgi:hypothetical protein
LNLSIKEKVVQDNIHVLHANMPKCLDAVLMELLKHGVENFMNLVQISMLFKLNNRSRVHIFHFI